MRKWSRRDLGRQLAGSLSLAAVVWADQQAESKPVSNAPEAGHLEKAEPDYLSVHPRELEVRRQSALQVRQQTARHQSQREVLHASNLDERNLPRWIACYSKGLPHTQSGEVEPGKYESLLKALASGKSANFKNLERVFGRPFVNPQAAYSYTL